MGDFISLGVVFPSWKYIHAAFRARQTRLDLYSKIVGEFFSESNLTAAMANIDKLLIHILSTEHS